MRRAISHILMLFLLPALAWAQSPLYDISGYLEYLSGASEFPAVQGTLYDQLLHLRINTKWYPSDALRGELDLRTRAYYGGSVEKIPRFRDQVESNYDLEDLDAVLWDERNSIGYAEIDRMWLDYSAGNLEVTLGRQRIAWGTALVWNVIDLYNPKSVLDFDYEEKPGADAIRLQYYTGAVSKLELAAKPGQTNDKAIVAGLLSTNAMEYDFYGIVGFRNNRWVAGGAWAGSVLDGGFRGEVLVSQPANRAKLAGGFIPPLFGGSILADNHPTVSVVLSGDYTFSNSLYIHTECLFNSSGKTSNAGVFLQEAADAEMLSPARWSLYQEFAYDITPLTRATAFCIFNPNDHSIIAVPMITRSLKTNLDLLMIGLIGSGKKYSEFRDYGKSVYIRLRYSF